MTLAQLLHPHNSAERKRVLVVAALVIALLTLIISLVIVSRASAPDVTNRAQTQVRSPDEEALANENWNPNHALAGQQALPAANTWSENFGKVLADVTGVDADVHLYPPGKAPAPGSIIAGSGEEEIILEDGNDANTASALPPEETAPALPAAAPAKNNNPYNARSPVEHLLNR